jgi:molecular chaperone DnaK
MSSDNKSLGKFHLDGIPAAPRGVPQVEVTFDIDANGILKVTAKDKATSKTQNITISGSSNLSKEEIERMKKEAEAHAEEDRKHKETIETRNQADTLIAVSERTLKDAGDKAPQADKQAVIEKVEALKAVKDKEDLAAIKSAMDDLSNAIQKVGASMYQQSPEAGKAGEKPGGNAKTEQGPVDAEFKDVSDKK